MRKIYIILLGMISAITLTGQVKQDSISYSLNINEVVITAQKEQATNRIAKPNSSIEEYLKGSEKIGMVKRGNYAWEPTINNMQTERISVTIDGMKIFHACTDKMDPVTSYVETNNLSKVSLVSGFGIDPQATNNIGGSLDLKLNKSGFCADGLGVNANTGYESNGNLWIAAASVSYANNVFYVNSGLSHRESGNYMAGGNQEIRYSQFAKNNFFTNVGYVIANGKAIEGTVIYDKAINVGYPALTMDVSSADGFISSLSYTVENPFKHFYKWESKVYFNNIIHIMDDTKRLPEEVPMHMDMPGETQTGGFYSSLNGKSGKHHYILNWDGFYNRSYAEMTMYPNNPNEQLMFMLTWPDIRTLNTGIFAVDQLYINKNNSLRLALKGSFQRDGINSNFGLAQNRGFFPEMVQYKNRFVGNISTLYQFKRDGLEANANIGYGNRAPSVSEAYGFYLFNTFDAYDYLGNPELKSESALETSLSASWQKTPIEIKAGVSNFYFSNYIIGKPAPGLYHMTIGATGVKVYENLPHASILNTNLSIKYWFLRYFSWSGKVTYARGKDNENANLPLISPLSYGTSLSFKNANFFGQAEIEGASKQLNYSPEYGEDETKAYLIANIAFGYNFRINKTIFNLKTGVENLFDKYYSTYDDWKNIPRKGRNVFVGLILDI